MKYEREYSEVHYNQSTIFKDRINKKLTGVCAGLANHFNCPSWVTRVATIIAFLMMPGITLIAYIVASLLLPSRTYVS